MIFADVELQEHPSAMSVAGLKHARQVGQVGLDDRVVRQQVGRLGQATECLCLDAKLGRRASRWAMTRPTVPEVRFPVANSSTERCQPA